MREGEGGWRTFQPCLMVMIGSVEKHAESCSLSVQNNEENVQEQTGCMRVPILYKSIMFYRQNECTHSMRTENKKNVFLSAADTKICT